MIRPRRSRINRRKVLVSFMYNDATGELHYSSRMIAKIPEVITEKVLQEIHNCVCSAMNIDNMVLLNLERVEPA